MLSGVSTPAPLFFTVTKLKVELVLSSNQRAAVPAALLLLRLLGVLLGTLLGVLLGVLLATLLAVPPQAAPFRVNTVGMVPGLFTRKPKVAVPFAARLGL